MNTKNFLLSIIPIKYRFQFVNIKNFFIGGYKRYYFSQNGEDVIVANIFNTLKIKKGFYIDVGAHHPQRYSNTNLLYLSGWSGINIDPNPESIRIFNAMRKKDINLNIGIAAKKSNLTYYNFSDPAVNTFSAESAAKYQNKSWISLVSSIEVPVFPLSEVLGENVPKNKKIDLLNIDAEGLDMEVLQSNDWTTFRPTVIIAEDHLFDYKKPDKSEIHSFLINKGYRLYTNLGFSLIFIQDT